MPKRVLDTHPEVDRIRKAMKRLIRESGEPMVEVASRAELNLYSILNEKQFLRAEHIFIVLDALQVSPETFFASVYRLRPPSEEEHRVAGIPQSEIEATVRRIVRGALADEEERRRNSGQ